MNTYVLSPHSLRGGTLWFRTEVSVSISKPSPPPNLKLSSKKTSRQSQLQGKKHPNLNLSPVKKELQSVYSQREQFVTLNSKSEEEHNLSVSTSKSEAENKSSVLISKSESKSQLDSKVNPTSRAPETRQQHQRCWKPLLKFGSHFWLAARPAGPVSQSKVAVWEKLASQNWLLA